MPETKQPMHACKIRKWCDNCFKNENLFTGEGEMIFIGGEISPDKNFFKYWHKCNKCRTEQHYERKYPYIIHSEDTLQPPFIYDEKERER